MTWGVFLDNDGRLPWPTYFAGLRRADLTFEWRSLSTSSRETARQWLDSARCHGVDAHTETCADCLDSERERLRAEFRRDNAVEDAARAKATSSSEQCPRCHVVFTNAGCRCVPGFM
jgi:hypothetical protein